MSISSYIYEHITVKPDDFLNAIASDFDVNGESDQTANLCIPAFLHLHASRLCNLAQGDMMAGKALKRGAHPRNLLVFRNPVILPLLLRKQTWKSLTQCSPYVRMGVPSSTSITDR